ncbi:MAG TPA: hypothetical protein VD927_00360 [Chryseosolibacter sp.]|nr:hypothetical protein [Chryseosolibacter sp.]
MMNDLKVFKGIEYIQLEELPQAQQEMMIKTINNSLFIKIMIDGKIIANCLQYKDYSNWYHTVYKPKPAPAEQSVTSAPVAVQAKLVLNN